MIVRSLEEVIGSTRDVDWGNGKSRRFLLENDGMNFTLTNTIVAAGSRSLLEYKKHLEACYCVSGSGQIEDPATGQVYDIRPGTMYALDKHDQHYLVAREDMQLLCVFVPALKGQESHRLDGQAASSY
jgi:L-ectoine synthase